MKKLFISISMLLLSGQAQAITIQWTLNNVTFDDGATASGSFVYQTETNTFSNVSIVTTPGTTLGGETYLNIAQSASYGFIATPTFQTDYTGVPSLSIISLSAGQQLDNPNENFAIPSFPFNQEAFCSDPLCSGTGGSGRAINAGGFLAATVIPIPAAVWLFGSGLGLLGWMRRKVS